MILDHLNTFENQEIGCPLQAIGEGSRTTEQSHCSSKLHFWNSLKWVNRLSYRSYLSFIACIAAWSLCLTHWKNISSQVPWKYLSRDNWKYKHLVDIALSSEYRYHCFSLLWEEMVKNGMILRHTWTVLLALNSKTSIKQRTSMEISWLVRASSGTTFFRIP